MYLPETGEGIYNSFLGVPVMYRRKVMGVLVVQNKERKTLVKLRNHSSSRSVLSFQGSLRMPHAVGNIDVFVNPAIYLPTKPSKVSQVQVELRGRAVILYPLRIWRLSLTVK